MKQDDAKNHRVGFLIWFNNPGRPSPKISLKGRVPTNSAHPQQDSVLFQQKTVSSKHLLYYAHQQNARTNPGFRGSRPRYRLFFSGIFFCGPFLCWRKNSLFTFKTKALLTLCIERYSNIFYIENNLLRCSSYTTVKCSCENVNPRRFHLSVYWPNSSPSKRYWQSLKPRH